MVDRRLLVMDDISEMGEVAGLIAANIGYEVQVLTDPKEFMGVVDSFKPTIVMLDIVMPDIDGFQLVKWLRARGCDAKVIVASAANLNYAKLARSLGRGRGLDISVVGKPYDVKELQAALS